MNWFELSEDVIILRPENTTDLAKSIREANLKGVIDIVQSETEIALQYIGEPNEILEQIDGFDQNQGDDDVRIFEIPVCYELGLDWQEVQQKTGLSKDEIIEKHSSVRYEAIYGFLPGFLYLSGLDEKVNCARKTNPRERIPAGSVGIGGDKTGIYSLESPGGWQIIGRTPRLLFDINSVSSFTIPNGAKVKFVPISKQTFDEWN